MGTAAGIKTANASPMARWYVIRTLPRSEKALCGELAAMDIKHEWPIVSRLRYFGRRRTTVSVPLVHGFVFLLGSPEHVFLASQTGRIAEVIDPSVQEALDHELAMIRLAIELDSSVVDSHPFPRHELTPAVVKGESRRGLEGLWDDCCPDRLILPISIIRQAVSITIDVTQLEIGSSERFWARTDESDCGSDDRSLGFDEDLLGYTERSLRKRYLNE